MHLSESRKFRTQLNIYDGVFSQKQLITVNRFSRYLFFLKKAPSQMFDQVLNAPLTPSTPPNYFCVRIIKTWRFFSTAELSSIPGTTLKSTFILLPFSINFISFATAFHALVTTPFSLYHLRCLSDSARHCFTFSHFLHFLLEWLLSDSNVVRTHNHFIPNRKCQVKPHSSPWFSAACAAAVVRRNFVCTGRINLLIFFLFFNWNSLHAKLNSHYEAWSHKKKKHKKITAYRKSVQKEPIVYAC